MKPESFWPLLAEVCQIGEFVAVIRAEGAEINLVGRLQVAFDGRVNVLEKVDCKDHFHIAPEQINSFEFGYCRLGTGGRDPCIRLVNTQGEACMRLYYYPYESGELKSLWEQFIERNEPHRHLITGRW